MNNPGLRVNEFLKEGAWLDRFCTKCHNAFRTKDGKQFICPKCMEE